MKNYFSLSAVYVCDSFCKNMVHCITTDLLGQSYRHDPISYTALTVLQEKHVWQYRLKYDLVYFISQ